LNFDFKNACEKRILHIHLLLEWRNEAYENTKLFEEKVKIWRDKRIQKSELKEGDLVLFFNSRLNFFVGKLVSKWDGHFVIQEVLLKWHRQ
jgi:hypothetical protein